MSYEKNICFLRAARYFAPRMATHTHEKTGAGNSAVQQWENIAHSMATILGQWIDEGDLADIADLKRKASAILDKYESMEYLQS